MVCVEVRSQRNSLQSIRHVMHLIWHEQGSKCVSAFEAVYQDAVGGRQDHSEAAEHATCLVKVMHVHHETIPTPLQIQITAKRSYTQAIAETTILSFCMGSMHTLIRETGEVNGMWPDKTFHGMARRTALERSPKAILDDNAYDNQLYTDKTAQPSNPQASIDVRKYCSSYDRTLCRSAIPCDKVKAILECGDQSKEDC